jgi:carboxymethylenebutenolidase
MAVQADWVTTQTPDGPMRVYVARPEGAGPFPGLIVIQEIFGVNDHIQDVTRRFAAEGFVAAAPEVYHRLAQKEVPYEDLQTAFGLRSQLTDDQVMMDVDATYELLNRDPQVRQGQIGIVGYCYGGRVAYLAATRNPNLKAVASYYGGRIVADDPNAPIHFSANIRAPLILFFGEQDQSIPMEQVRQIDETLKRLGKQYELHTYPQAGHGFFCDHRPAHYNAEAAADAWAKTLQFFRQHLAA